MVEETGAEKKAREEKEKKDKVAADKKAKEEAKKLVMPNLDPAKLPSGVIIQAIKVLSARIARLEKK